MTAESQKNNFSQFTPWILVVGIIGCFASFHFPLLNRERGMAAMVMDLQEKEVISADCLPAERLYAYCGRILCDWVGFSDSETLLRLPAFLGALAALLAVVYLLRRREAAVLVLAVLLLGGSYGFLHWARIASPEMVETALYTWILALIFSDGQRHRLAVSVLAVIGLVLWQWHFLILLTALPAVFWQQFTAEAFRKWLMTFLSLAALVAANIWFCGHFTDVSWLIPGWPELLSRQQLASHGYGCGALIYLPRLLLPWTPLAVGVLIQIIRFRLRKIDDGAEGRELRNWLLALALPMLVLALALPLKCRSSWENWLPLLPALTGICAAGLRQYHSWPDDRMRQFYFFTVNLVASVMSVAVLTWPVWDKLLGKHPGWGLATASVVLGLSVLWLQNSSLKPVYVGRRQPWTRIVFNTALLSLFVQAILQPLTSSFRYEKLYWVKCREALKGKEGKLIFCSDDDRGEPDGIGRFYLHLSEEELKRSKFVKIGEIADWAAEVGDGAWIFFAGKPDQVNDLKRAVEIIVPKKKPNEDDGRNAGKQSWAYEEKPLSLFADKEEKVVRRLYRAKNKERN